MKISVKEVKESIQNVNGNMKRVKVTRQHNGKKGVEVVEDGKTRKVRKFKVKRNKIRSPIGLFIIPRSYRGKSKRTKRSYRGKSKRTKMGSRGKSKKTKRSSRGKSKKTKRGSKKKGFFQKIFGV
jgi:hypothetical protein